MSRIFPTNWGSLENLKFSTRCRCRPNACQVRTTAVCDSAVFRAMRRLLHCVPFSGIDSRVCVTTASICPSVTDRGAPGRGSSNKRSNRFTRNRSRHLQTVTAARCSRFATAPLLNPPSQPRAMLAHMATAGGDLGRRANMDSYDFLSGVTLSGLAGRPMAMTKYAPVLEVIPCISDSGHQGQ